jgi:hypothetical protein
MCTSEKHSSLFWINANNEKYVFLAERIKNRILVKSKFQMNKIDWHKLLIKICVKVSSIPRILILFQRCHDNQYNNISFATLRVLTFNMITFSITTLSILTFSIITFSITTLSITPFSILTFSITNLNIITLSIFLSNKGIFVTFSIKNTQNNNTAILLSLASDLLLFWVHLCCVFICSISLCWVLWCLFKVWIKMYAFRRITKYDN